MEKPSLAEQAQSIETPVNPGRQSRPEAWRNTAILKWRAFLNDREDQVFLALTLVIGALVGLIVVAFIEITGRFGARLYPPDAAAWRRCLLPVAGSLVMGYLLYQYFQSACGVRVLQTHA